MTNEEAFWEREGRESAVVREEPTRNPVYDLEERTARFGEAVIRFSKRIPFTSVNNRLIDQLVGAGTSVGANYCEADEGHSSKEFRYRISFCCKEAKETKFFLRMVATAEPPLKPDARTLWQEARELYLIFCAVLRAKPRLQ